MKGEEENKSWQEKSEEINQGMNRWRKEHPKARFNEIEEELDRRMAELRAEMLAACRREKRAEDGLIK